MKLTDVSQYILKFVSNKSKCVSYQPLSHTTSTFFTTFFEKMKQANSFVENKKREIFSPFQIFKNQIKKPKSNHIPSNLWRRIENKTKNTIIYTNQALGKKVEIIFAVEDSTVYKEEYDEYVKYVMVWLYILFHLTPRDRNCAADGITIYFYFSPFMKLLPERKNEALNENHCNTAYTFSCSNEITIYRKEDWFKTFIHETFHTFSLDFSQMNNEKINKKILNMFHVESEVNLYEAYTEFWATIINILFCSFFNSANKLQHAEALINADMNYALFQMVKVLDHFGLRYLDLLQEMQTKHIYKEDTSVMSYYIIKTILLLNYNSFIKWCEQENTTYILNFQKTMQSQMSFVSFIERLYRSPSFIAVIECEEATWIENTDPFLRETLKMTLCELG
jgi:hypothetical protein